jgi:hypothetical protein
MNPSRRTLIVFGIPLALLAVVQVVPYGRDHSNPPAGATPTWDSPGTLALARRACFDCHSNQTHWPWYSNLAPLSWRIQNHVMQGREKLNFSDQQLANEAVGEAAAEAGETVTKREMPPFDYALAHPEARLTPAEELALAAGLDATFGTARRKGGGNSRKAGEEGESGERSEESEHRGSGRRDH